MYDDVFGKWEQGKDYNKSPKALTILHAIKLVISV